MARNGSGTFTKVNTFTAGTPITAASHNQNWDDAAAEITNSVAADGQTSMTGPLKASSGTSAAPSHTFASDLDTGGYRSATNEYSVAAGGAQIAAFSADGVDIKEGTLKLAGADAFPVPTAQIADKAVTFRKLQRPSTTSVLLGSNSNAALTITGAANNGSGLIRLTVGSTSTFATSQKKTVLDVLGTTEANGTWTITVVDATHIDLQGSTFSNAYVSGGTIGGAFEEITIGAGLVLSGSTLTAPAVAQGYLFGLTLSNGTDATNDIDIAAGKCRDALDTQNIVLSAITKQLDSAWSAGTNAGGRSSASLADGTWHVFAIAKADGTADVLFHTAVDPTSVLPTDYTVYRRIGSILRESGAIVGFVQYENKFLRSTIAADVSSTPGLNAVTQTLSVPSGIVVEALVRASLYSDRTDLFTGLLLTPLSVTDATPSLQNAQLVLPRAGTNPAMAEVAVFTNTSRQIRSRVGNTAGAAVSHTMTISTFGWNDRRGQAA